MFFISISIAFFGQTLAIVSEKISKFIISKLKLETWNPKDDND